MHDCIYCSKRYIIYIANSYGDYRLTRYNTNSMGRGSQDVRSEGRYCHPHPQRMGKQAPRKITPATGGDVTQYCKTRLTNLSTTWTDYKKKACDSVPNTLIPECFEQYKVNKGCGEQHLEANFKPGHYQVWNLTIRCSVHTVLYITEPFTSLTILATIWHVR